MGALCHTSNMYAPKDFDLKADVGLDAYLIFFQTPFQKAQDNVCIIDTNGKFAVLIMDLDYFKTINGAMDMLWAINY